MFWIPRPYIDLVGGSGQVKVKEVHWATNAETVVWSQEVPENKVCAVLASPLGAHLWHLQEIGYWGKQTGLT